MENLSSREKSDPFAPEEANSPNGNIKNNHPNGLPVSCGSRFLSFLLHDFGLATALDYAVVFPGKKWPLTPSHAHWSSRRR